MRTQERWRWVGQGPQFLKIGGRVIYRIETTKPSSARRIALPEIGIESDPLPKVGSPDAGVFRLDQGDGLVASLDFVSMIGTLFPSRRVVVPRCSIDAKPPTFRPHLPASGTSGGSEYWMRLAEMR